LDQRGIAGSVRRVRKDPANAAETAATRYGV
jgi:hypothetical protein